MLWAWVVEHFDPSAFATYHESYGPECSLEWEDSDDDDNW
jgi:hypothetical protein